MQIIPLTSAGSRRISVPLGTDIGVITFRTYWNPLAPCWYVDLLDENDVMLAAGLAMVPRINIIRYDPVLVARIGDLRVADLRPVGPRGPQNQTADILGKPNGLQLVHFAPGEYDLTYPAQIRPLRYINVDMDAMFRTELFPSDFDEDFDDDFGPP